MEREHPNDPLHGITLQALLEYLVERFGWNELALRIPIRCFSNDPTSEAERCGTGLTCISERVGCGSAARRDGSAACHGWIPQPARQGPWHRRS